jgi:hypothetical protein
MNKIITNKNRIKKSKKEYLLFEVREILKNLIKTQQKKK